MPSEWQVFNPMGMLAKEKGERSRGLEFSSAWTTLPNYMATHPMIETFHRNAKMYSLAVTLPRKSQSGDHVGLSKWSPVWTRVGVATGQQHPPKRVKGQHVDLLHQQPTVSTCLCNTKDIRVNFTCSVKWSYWLCLQVTVYVTKPCAPLTYDCLLLSQWSQFC